VRNGEREKSESGPFTFLHSLTFLFALWSNCESVHDLSLFFQVCQSPKNGASYDKIGDQSTASCDTKTEPPKLLYKTA